MAPGATVPTTSRNENCCLETSAIVPSLHAPQAPRTAIDFEAVDPEVLDPCPFNKTKGDGASNVSGRTPEGGDLRNHRLRLFFYEGQRCANTDPGLVVTPLEMITPRAGQLPDRPTRPDTTG